MRYFSSSFVVSINYVFRFFTARVWTCHMTKSRTYKDVQNVFHISGHLAVAFYLNRFPVQVQYTCSIQSELLRGSRALLKGPANLADGSGLNWHPLDYSSCDLITRQRPGSCATSCACDRKVAGSKCHNGSSELHLTLFTHFYRVAVCRDSKLFLPNDVR